MAISLSRAIAIILAADVAGCATVLSTQEEKPAPPLDGLVYWLPKRDIQITVNFTKGNLKSIAATSTAAYADLSTGPFVAQYGRNLIGKNELTVSVNSAGLLDTESTTKTTIQLDELVAALTKINPASAHVAENTPRPTKCSGVDKTGDLVYTFRVKADDPDASFQIPGTTNCKISVTIGKPSGEVGVDTKMTGGKAHSGFFYREMKPVDVTTKLEGDETRFSDVVSLPNWGPTRFLPLPRALFADNSANVTFAEGVPTKWTTSTDGDAIALFKLPAEVIKAYFAAAGAILSARGGDLTAQASYLQNYEKLLARQQSLAACKAAIAGGSDGAKIAAACKDTGI